MKNRCCPPNPHSPAAAPKRNHQLLMVAFFFLIGCLSLPFLEGGAWLWLLAAIGAALCALCRLDGRRMCAGVAVVCFALGALHANHAFSTPMPEAGTYEITGYVYGEGTRRSGGRLSFVLGDVTLDGAPAPGKAYCTLRYAETLPELFDGAHLRFEGRVYHPDGKSGEPRMDFQLWMRQQGYRFGISIYEEIAVENTPASAPAKDAAFRVRQVFRTAFERTMGSSGRIAMALLLGEREGLTEDEYAAFQDLGIAHVMSVSGLHVGLVGGMVMLLLGRFRLRRRTRLAILSVFLLDYCALTGFSPASLRAAVMLIFASMSRLCCRRGDRLATLCAAMLAVLIIDPLSALSAGFVLSFSAMLGIILFAPSVQAFLDRLWPPKAPDRRMPEDRAARWQVTLKSLMTVSFCAQVGVLLPTMRYFHQLPLYGLVINLFIVPLTGSVLVPMYLLVLICSLFPFIGQAAGGAAALATELLLWLVDLLSRLPCAVIRTPAPPVPVCVGLGTAMLLLSRRMPGTFRRRAAAALLTALLAVGGWLVYKPAELRYIQLDVGQADAALLMDGQTTVVIDTGADGSAVIDYLRHENRSVDALILTHLHLDHAGGVPALLESGIPIQRIYLPAAAEKQLLNEAALDIHRLLLSQDIPLSTLASGDELRYNRSMIRVLWPERETVRSGQNANDYSLAMSISLDGFTMLHAGDLTGLYERYAAVPADVLKVAHHGSRDSTSDAFLDFVDPSFALLCVSGGGFLPSAETLQRLEERPIGLFRTDEYGDITLSVENGRLSVTPYKERNN